MIKKICTKCEEKKLLSEFYEHKGKPYCWCKSCVISATTKYHFENRNKRLAQMREYGRAYQQQNREKVYFKTAKRKYGISNKEYKKLLERQKGVCAICKNSEKVGRGGVKFIRLGVDHCHKTKRVRGLLCVQCNTMLGQYEKHRKSVGEYLKK